MELVCKDDDGDWYYIPETESYQRINDGEVRGKITGKHLPNPHFLLKKRKRLYPQAKEQDIEPNEATYKLWEHWNAVKDTAAN